MTSGVEASRSAIFSVSILVTLPPPVHSLGMNTYGSARVPLPSTLSPLKPTALVERGSGPLYAHSYLPTATRPGCVRESRHRAPGLAWVLVRQLRAI